MRYFLGVDVGGTKTHALISDEEGALLGFGSAGTGNWEAVGYAGLTSVLLSATRGALQMAGLVVGQISGAGMGLAGFDWPSQKQAHLDAVAPLGLQCPIEIVNDATLGIVAGSEEGWGVSVGAGTGCNCRGWSKDHRREGRMVGGKAWSGEYGGGYDILMRAMQAVAFEWNRRGPTTALSKLFLQQTGAASLDELVEGAYLGRYDAESVSIRLVFQAAAEGDAAALDIMRWAGEELGGLAVGVIRQLDLQQEAFDVVLIGSIYDGHPLITESLRRVIQAEAPNARLVRLSVPPVVGAVLLGMEAAGLDFRPRRVKLIESMHHMHAD